MTKIKARRNELKKLYPGSWSQIDVAIKCGVSMLTYQLWERGAVKPTEENEAKLLEVLGLGSLN